MPIDLFAVLKAAWGVITFLMLGMLKIFYSDWKKSQERLDLLDKEMIRMRAVMVTNERLDEVLDNKLAAIRDDVSALRKDIKDDVSGLRGDLQKQFQLLLEKEHR